MTGREFFNKQLNSCGTGIIINKDSEYFHELMSITAEYLEDNECVHNYNCLLKACARISKNYNVTINTLDTIVYMMKRGGYCDCEVMMNVAYY